MKQDEHASLDININDCLEVVFQCPACGLEVMYQADPFHLPRTCQCKECDTAFDVRVAYGFNIVVASEDGGIEFGATEAWL